MVSGFFHFLLVYFLSDDCFGKIKLFEHCPGQGGCSVGQDLGQTVCKVYLRSTNAPTSMSGV